VSELPDVRTFPRSRTLPLRLDVLCISAIVAVVLVAASWLTVLNGDRIQQHGFFSTETLERSLTFLRDLLGIGTGRTPAFAQWEEWRKAATLAYDTLAMSVLGIGFAAIVAFATFMFGARNVMVGELAPYGSWVWRVVFVLVRGLYIAARGIPELVWAMVIIFVLSPGLLPGAVALGLHNSGILGKLASEVVEGLDPRPIRAMRSTGAGHMQVMVYAVLPQALPRFMTYLLYRWEVIIRTTIVVGFVAAGGLGLQFRLSMNQFHYTAIAMLLVWYLILVVGVDLLAAGLRRLAR